MLTAYDYVELNNRIHGKLNCGQRGYYPIPQPSARFSEDEPSTAVSKEVAINKAVTTLRKTSK